MRTVAVLARYVIPAAVIEGCLLGLVALEDGFRPFALFLGLCGVATAAFAWATWRSWRDERASGGVIAFVFLAGVVFRATLLPFPPADDMNRYLWEGRVQLAGFNPYVHPPESERLAPLRDDVVYPGINGKPYTAIYPPLAQLVFRGDAAIRVDFTTFKVVFTLFDLATAFVVLSILRHRGAPVARVLAYLWCPLLLFTVAGRGHVDAIQTFFTVSSIALFLRRRVGWSAFALGLAVMAKTVSILVLPALLLHARRPVQLWPVVLPAALYLLYADAGSGLFRSFGMFGKEWSTNASLYLLLSADNTHRWIVYTVAGAAYFVVLLRAKTVEDAGFGAWAVFSIFTPTFHPWYFSAIFPFLAMRWRPAWLVLSGTLFCYYSFVRHGTWEPISWIPWVEYAPFFLVLLWSWWSAPELRRGTS